MALRQDRFSILQSQGIRANVIKLGYIPSQIKETLSFVEPEQNTWSPAVVNADGWCSRLRD